MADFSALSSPFALVLVAVLWGMTEKIADLLDEHGLKWFPGANILFGVLWGFFLSLLVISQNFVVASLAFARLLSYILRYRIDYLNHGIAAVTVLVAFAANNVQLAWTAFWYFFAVFAIGGFIHDSLDERPAIKKWLGKHLTAFFEYRGHIYLFPLIFSAVTGEWLAFAVATAHMLPYELVRQWYGSKNETE